MDKDLCILFEPIDPDKLTIACHSDTAFANVGEHTQAGTSSPSPRNLCKMGLKPNGYPLHGAVINSVELLVVRWLQESQAFCTASGSVEWLSLMLAEILDGDFESPRTRRRAQKTASDFGDRLQELVSSISFGPHMN